MYIISWLITFFTRVRISGLEATRILPLAWVNRNTSNHQILLLTSFVLQEVITNAKEQATCKYVIYGLGLTIFRASKLQMDLQMYDAQNVDLGQFEIYLQLKYVL